MGREFDEDLDVCECTNVHGVVMEEVCSMW